MNKNLEKELNNTAYVLIIAVELIYIYVSENENKLSDEKKNDLVTLGRFILFLTALYFLINAYITHKRENNKGQFKQLVAAFFAIIAAIIRLTIKDDDITFR